VPVTDTFFVVRGAVPPRAAIVVVLRMMRQKKNHAAPEGAAWQWFLSRWSRERLVRERRGMRRRDHFGMSTVSTTWMTPLVVSMSVAISFALSILALPCSTLIVTLSPCSVLA
jgi:hypothetical protein